eukprot:12726428-Alexandrium_andersonii.AAC.1
MGEQLPEIHTRMRAVSKAIACMFNGDWTRHAPQHFCWDPLTSRPCCASPEEVCAKMTSAFMPVMELVCSSGGLPRENQWFKLVESLKPWAFGASCHLLLPRIFVSGLQVQVKATDNLEVPETDSWQDMNSKRSKQAA